MYRALDITCGSFFTSAVVSLNEVFLAVDARQVTATFPIHVPDPRVPAGRETRTNRIFSRAAASFSFRAAFEFGSSSRDILSFSVNFSGTGRCAHLLSGSTPCASRSPDAERSNASAARMSAGVVRWG